MIFLKEWSVVTLLITSDLVAALCQSCFVWLCQLWSTGESLTQEVS